MKYQQFKKSLVKTSLFLVLCLTVFATTAKAGLDYYEIYLGKKLIFKRALNVALSLESLPISQDNVNEQLVIYYYQCNAPDKLATKRSITLKDENGNTIKEWKFADAGKSNPGMSIPVKELLQLQKANKGNALNLFYAAEGKVKSEKLASIAANTRAVGYINEKQNEFALNDRLKIFVCKEKISGVATYLPRSIISLLP